LEGKQDNELKRKKAESKTCSGSLPGFPSFPFLSSFELPKKKKKKNIYPKEQLSVLSFLLFFACRCFSIVFLNFCIIISIPPLDI